MGRFVYGEELNSELIKLIRKADEFLFFVSPYVKLHERLKDQLRALDKKESLTLMLLFGKNQEDISRSLSREELEFFREFPNVDIRYEPRLHAKYYGNESTSILTSMNLYDYSMNNNIESGTVYDDRFDFTKRAGNVAFDYFNQVFTNAEVIYSQRIDVKSSFGGLRKRYGEVRVLADHVNKHYGSVRGERRENYGSRTSHTYPSSGYCIRTGQKIRFDLDRPLSNEAYRTWSSFANPDYPERYCHFSGEESMGETSYGHPVLRKYWNSVRAFA